MRKGRNRVLGSNGTETRLAGEIFWCRLAVKSAIAHFPEHGSLSLLTLMIYQ
jgi:hypothetical protein